MTRTAPYFDGYVYLGEVGEPEPELRAKIISGQLKAHVYSAVANGDFEPVPLAAAKFLAADEAGWQGFSDPNEKLLPFQIAVVDRDARRPVAARRRIPVPHWIYLKQEPAPTKAKSRAGRKPTYDWHAIRLFVFDQLTSRGDFEEPDQLSGWRSAADLYRAIADKFGDMSPELTTLKEKVPALVTEWRKVGS